MLTRQELQKAFDPRIHMLPDPFKEHSDERMILYNWKGLLRRNLFEFHKGRSTLTLMPLHGGFQVHESIFPRRYVPKSVDWDWRIFAGPNTMLLKPEEHIPHPPDRVLAYWVACMWYGKILVDKWIDDLPFKTPPDKPWTGTNPYVHLNNVPKRYKIDNMWTMFIASEAVRKNLGV